MYKAHHITLAVHPVWYRIVGFLLLCSALHSAYSPSHGVIGMICIVQLVHDPVWPFLTWMEISGWLMKDGLIRVGTIGEDFCMFRNTKNSSAYLCILPPIVAANGIYLVISSQAFRYVF